MGAPRSGCAFYRAGRAAAVRPTAESLPCAQTRGEAEIDGDLTVPSIEADPNMPNGSVRYGSDHLAPAQEHGEAGADGLGHSGDPEEEVVVVESPPTAFEGGPRVAKAPRAQLRRR